jgi:hypothetical protein
MIEYLRQMTDCYYRMIVFMSNDCVYVEWLSIYIEWLSVYIE